MALDRRNYRQLVETTVVVAQKVGCSQIVGRIVEDLKDESEPYRRMVMETIDKARFHILTPTPACLHRLHSLMMLGRALPPLGHGNHKWVQGLGCRVVFSRLHVPALAAGGFISCP